MLALVSLVHSCTERKTPDSPEAELFFWANSHGVYSSASRWQGDSYLFHSSKVSESIPRFVLNGGGFAAGGPFDPESGGRAYDAERSLRAARLLAEIPCDAVVPGDDEFASGVMDSLAQLLPLVCANRPQGFGPPEMPAYRVLERGGVRLCVIGAASPASWYVSGPQLPPAAEALRACLEELPPHDFTILLTHWGDGVDTLTASLPGVDLVVNANDAPDAAPHWSRGGIPIVELGGRPTGCFRITLGGESGPKVALLSSVPAIGPSLDPAASLPQAQLSGVKGIEPRPPLDLYLSLGCPHCTSLVETLLQLPATLLQRYELHSWILTGWGAPASAAERRLAAARKSLAPIAWLELFLCASETAQISLCWDAVGGGGPRLREPSSLNADRARTEGLGLTESPTLYLRNRQYSGGLDSLALERALCKGLDSPPLSPCGDLPACSSSEECQRRGSIGTCLDPGKKEARCSYRQAPVVPAVMIWDSTAVVPLVDEITGTVQRLLPGIEVRRLEIHSREAPQWIEDAGIRYLPALLLLTPPAGAIADIFIERRGGWLLNPAVSGADVDWQRERIPGRLDLLIPPGAAEAEVILQGVIQAMKMSGAETEIHIVPLLPSSLEVDSPVWRRAADWWMVEKGGGRAWEEYLLGGDIHGAPANSVNYDIYREEIEAGLRAVEEWLSELDVVRDRPVFLAENHEVVRVQNGADLWRLLAQLKGRE